MNTNDEKIQWHPAFDAALQIEFGDEAKYLEFDPEHLISKKPMQIDVLVKNEKHVKLKKNIRRVFRQYNIIEYKSPEDDLDIDDFYKTYAYACLYKSDTETVDMIPADELTITFVCYHYPRNMLRKLEQDRKFSVEQQDSGIYYLVGDAIPIQLVIVPKLSKEHNYWLNNLRNDLKAGSEIRKFIESYSKNKNSKLYQALADAVMRANWEKLKAGSRAGMPAGLRVESKADVILPVIPILAHRGLFGMVENGWKFIWVAAIMILLPFVSSLVGIILGSIQLKKTSTKPVKIGVLLSCTGLVLHLLFRFVFKF